MEFNVGDRIKIVNDEYYAITVKGSEGIVIEVIKGYLYVEFDLLGGNPVENPEYDGYTVEAKHCKLVKPLSQQERVTNKIRSMYARQYRKTGQPCFL